MTRFIPKPRPIVVWCCVVVAILGAFLAMAQVSVEAQEASGKKPRSYEVSWVGNSIGGSEGRIPNGDNHGTAHVQMDVDAIWVSPDGKVYANCQADEGHLQGGVYQDGKLIWSIQIPWGRGGLAITGDEKFIYAAHGRGFVRYNRESGKPDSSTVLDSKLITGLTVANNQLYASNYTDGKIHVFDQSLKEQATLEVPFPGALAVDPSGTIYVAQFEDLWNQPKNRLGEHRNKVLRFSDQGQSLEAIVMEKNSRPVALHLDQDGRLLVADNGPDQNVKIYSTGGKPRFVGHFGEVGGVYAKPIGVHGPRRFNGLCGLGTDAKGNLYVAYNGQGPAREVGNKTWNDAGFTGTVLDSYSPDGKRRWVLYGLLFCDVIDVDPATNGRNVFSAKQHYTMDHTKPAGQQWTYHGVLVNPFKYPDDPRLTSDNTNRGTAFVRRIKGQRILFTTGMYAGTLHIFRFNEKTDGEVAIPCGRVGRGFWYDANGNGRPEDGETQSGEFGGWGLHVDAQGDIWTTAKGISHLPLRGLDEHGTPVYQIDKIKNEAVPAPFTTSNA
jgi:DNA-binding beta-propeller fold protein YncE